LRTTRPPRTRGNIILQKVWDGSPIDPWAFDPTTPPLPVPPPVNTTAPTVAILDGLEVDMQLIATPGTWTGSPTLTRQWFRDGSAIPGATIATYTLTVADVGAMITVAVTGTNVSGSATSTSTPVGPVIEAASP
jgi:hypothetical protein